MRFLENAWYMAAWASQIGTNIVARRLLDQPVVLLRNDAGEVLAFEDRCPHRFAPLRLGKRTADGIECAYHGLRFDRRGLCVGNPSGKAPPGARVKAYPVVQRHQMIWIWMGDPLRADPATIPDFSVIPEASRGACNLGNYLHVKANYLLEIDNLMDLSHVNFLHNGTLGNESMRGHRIRVTARPGMVRADLFMPNSIAQFGAFAGQRCDQWNNMIWMAPTRMLLEVGATAPGSPVTQRTEDLAVHIVTPETARTTHYFYGSCGEYSDGEAWIAEHIRAAQTRAFMEEDNPMIEAIDEQMQGADLWSLRPALLGNDTGAVRVRRQLEALIALEQTPQTRTSPLSEMRLTADPEQPIP